MAHKLSVDAEVDVDRFATQLGDTYEDIGQFLVALGSVHHGPAEAIVRSSKIQAKHVEPLTTLRDWITTLIKEAKKH